VTVFFSEQADDIDVLRAGQGSNNRVGNSSGSTYVRWGRMTCPSTSELVYDGYAGGGYHGEQGLGTTYLCLPPRLGTTANATTRAWGRVPDTKYDF